MSATQELEYPKVRWDLSVLFSGMDDPKIDETWTRAMARCEAFETAYRGKIDSPDLTADTLSAALNEIESIYVEVAKPMSFAGLNFATDSGDPKIGAFMQKMQEKGTELSVKTMFFELELQAADE